MIVFPVATGLYKNQLSNQISTDGLVVRNLKMDSGNYKYIGPVSINDPIQTITKKSLISNNRVISLLGNPVQFTIVRVKPHGKH